MAQTYWLNVRYSRLLSLTLATACLLLLGQSAQAVTIAEIKEARQKHSASFNAISYKFQQVKTEDLYTKATNDPFAPPDADEVKEKVSLKGSLTFVRAGERAAVTRVAEFWDDQQGKPVERKQIFSFDGKQNLGYIGRSMGRIESADAPGDSINNHVELIPLWWAHWPQERLVFHGDVQFDDAVASDEPLDCGGASCIELTVQAPKSPDSVQQIYVDAAHGFRVVRVNHFYKDVLRREVTLEYENDDAFGWKVVSFKSNYFDQEGERSFTLESKVDGCEFNPPLTERAFQVDFPVGTRIAKDGKYFEQEPNGKLREIEEEKFLQPPPKQGEL